MDILDYIFLAGLAILILGVVATAVISFAFGKLFAEKQDIKKRVEILELLERGGDQKRHSHGTLAAIENETAILNDIRRTLEMYSVRNVQAAEENHKILSGLLERVLSAIENMHDLRRSGPNGYHEKPAGRRPVSVDP